MNLYRTCDSWYGTTYVLAEDIMSAVEKADEHNRKKMRGPNMMPLPFGHPASHRDNTPRAITSISLVIAIEDCVS